MAASFDSLRVTARSIYGVDPDEYAAGRPDYPRSVYDLLADRCGLKPGSLALEIGAGTGMVTRRLVEAGAHVVVVEPDPRMAAYLLQDCGSAVDCSIGTFEEVDVGDARFDLVVAATSFHWVDQAAGLPKLGRALKPGGWAALWWTIYDDPESDDSFVEALSRKFGRDDPGGQRQVAYQLDSAARSHDLAESAGLESVGSEFLRWTADLSPHEHRALYGSLINVRTLPTADRNRLLDLVENLTEHQFGGTVTRHFMTVLYYGRRPDSRR